MSAPLRNKLLFSLLSWLVFPLVTLAQTEVSDTLKKETSFIQSEVHYVAKDSTIIKLQSQQVLLYHLAQVNYEDIELQAEHIILDWNDNTVYAVGMADSTGTIIGKPIFKEGGKTYHCESIRYDFTTKKGKIKGLKTQDGEGYIHGDELKKRVDNSMFISSSKYTTCSLDEPHFYIGAKKLKIIPGDKIVTGPANLVIAGIPSPLFVPFGFFPNQDKQSSGLIMPTYGYSPTRGYNFRNGGYYFSLSEHMDMALRGDIYTLGSWKLKAQSSYKKRYHYNGNFSLSYAKNILGEENLPNFSENRDFFINWTHNQDAKAHPNRRFSAKVNAGTSTFNKYNAYQSNDYLKNTLESNVSYSYSWAGKPFNLSANLRHSQNTLNNTVNLKLPDVAFTMNRINPFERKVRVGKQKWYEKIGLTYSLNAKNQIKTIDSLLFRKESLDDMKYGFNHRIPISSSFKLFKYIDVSPSANYNERWYFNRIENTWNEDELQINTDTISGLRAVRDFNTNLRMSTKLYGMVQLKGKNIKAIRHVFSPSITFSYRPDFSEESWGYYDWVQSDSTGTERMYSYYEEGLFGTAPSGKSGNISFGFDNNLEIKIRNKKDSLAGFKKVAIFKNLSFTGSYNLANEEYKLSKFKLNGTTQLSPNMSIKYRSDIDPYLLDEGGSRIDTYAWEESWTLGRLTAFNIALSWKLKSTEDNSTNPQAQGSDQQLEMIQNHPEDYVDFNIPWNLSVNYSYNYNKPSLETVIRQTLNFNGNIRLTDKWKIGFRSGYDFDLKELSYTSLDFYRDLHCWELRFNWIPYGFRQSYNISISVKSAVLQDLKLNKRKSFYDF